MSRYPVSVIAALVVAAASTGAYAASTHIDNDAVIIKNAKVSLVEAIKTAETNVNGKAAQAKFDDDAKHGPVYKIEVVSDSKVFDVKVDATKGTMISAKQDIVDND